MIYVSHAVAKYFIYVGMVLNVSSSLLYASHGILAEGKTKIICACPDDPTLARITSKDDITAGDGAKHDVISGKAALATKTTCNVFRLLKACGIPVAFNKQLDDTTFLAPYCTMIPYEFVVRREAHGSFLKRNPGMHKGEYFPHLVVEFFLKTNNRQWQGTSIPKDDPLIQFRDGKAELFLPDVPVHQQKPFMILDTFPLCDTPELFEKMSEIGQKTFLILEKAWQSVGARLVDFKVEFGFDMQGNLLLADVIDNDSWRVIHDNHYIDKQVYRDGGDLNKVTMLYQLVAQLTSQFTIPKQQIILWRGSEKDDIKPFEQTFEAYAHCGCTLTCVTQSAHKSPIACCMKLNELVRENPDSVLIAFVGMSNAAGPMLSAQTSIPVITVPATWKQCPEDIWSSLRMPSNVVAMTMLDANNAMLAALQILAMHNPALYAQVRLQQEKRLMNIVALN